MVPQLSRELCCRIFRRLAIKRTVRMTSEMFGFAREAADWSFPLVAERISQLEELLEIDMLRDISAWWGDPAEELQADNPCVDRRPWCTQRSPQ
jgi:hypothetical protein